MEVADTLYLDQGAAQLRVALPSLSRPVLSLYSNQADDYYEERPLWSITSPTATLDTTLRLAPGLYYLLLTDDADLEVMQVREVVVW